MKYLKYFENNQNKYKIGDFVIGQIDCDSSDDNTIEEYNNYFDNAAGQIVDMEITGGENDFYTLFYIDIPESIFEIEDENNVICIGPNQIIRYATQQEIEIFKMKENTGKFNL